MKKSFLLIFLIIDILTAATLLNQNIYERDNRVDLMLSFDAPFVGSIKKSTDQSSINILLSKVEIQHPFSKELQDKLVNAISIIKVGNDKALVKISPTLASLKIQASKTIDGFGLRIRITPATAIKNKLTQTRASSLPLSQQLPTLNTLKTSDTLPGWRYWIVLAILFILLLILWIIKKKNSAKGIGSHWLLPKGIKHANLPDEAVVHYQKQIDRQNKIILMEYNDRQYLILVGNTNLLLDTFAKGKIENPDSFNQMFEKNKKQLDHFLKESQPDAYEAFKEKASKEERLNE